MGLYFSKCTYYHGSLPPPPLFFSWYCEMLVMLYLANGTPQQLYMGMQKYVFIGLMKLYLSNPSDKIIPNIIYIIFWRIVYMVSIKKEIIPNLPFRFSGPLLVILNVYCHVYYGDTRWVLIIVYYCMCSDNKNEFVLTIEMNVYLQ